MCVSCVVCTNVTSQTLASAAVHASFEVNASLIVAVCHSGRTATLMSKYRPNCPIICVTSNDTVARKLQMYRGLHAIKVPVGTSVRECKRVALTTAKTHGIAEKGDRVVAVHGSHSMPGEAGVQITMTHML